MGLGLISIWLRDSVECQFYIINFREYRTGNQKWTIQRNKTKTEQIKNKKNTICIRHHKTQTNTNNVNMI